MDAELNQITEKIIGCAYTVSNTLGCGFLEKVYENALACELQLAGFTVKQQYSINVYYKKSLVGEFVADLLVNDLILVELKAAKNLDEIHYAQCLNYLHATKLPCCLLINFAKPKIEIKRFAGHNDMADK